MGIRIDRALWGAADVTCEECGMSLHSHEAVWRAQHPYCSVAHERQDHEDLVGAF